MKKFFEYDFTFNKYLVIYFPNKYDCVSYHLVFDTIDEIINYYNEFSFCKRPFTSLSQLVKHYNKDEHSLVVLYCTEKTKFINSNSCYIDRLFS